MSVSESVIELCEKRGIEVEACRRNGCGSDSIQQGSGSRHSCRSVFPLDLLAKEVVANMYLSFKVPPEVDLRRT